MTGLYLLHGTFVDEFLIEIVLPLSVFAGLYWWSARKERRKRAPLGAAKKEAVKGDLPDQPPGP